MKAPLVEAAEKLLATVQREFEGDLPNAPAWFGPEGERVRDNCAQFLEAAKNGVPHALLQGSSLSTYLGAAWVDTHSEVYEQVKVVQKLLS